MKGEWTLTTLVQIAQLHEEQVGPASTSGDVFHRFSISAFDAGRTPFLEIGCAIRSNKSVLPRAHNQGQLKFHDQVGVRKLEWMTMEDERVSLVCGPLDGKVFDTNRFPQQPAHPNCRCTSVVAWSRGRW